MADNSNIDANVVIELALNKVIELQKQVILTEAKFVSLRQDYDRLKNEFEIYKIEKEKGSGWEQSPTTRKSTTK